MTKEQLYEVIGDINEKHIKEAENTMKTNKKNNWIKWGAVAACLAIVAVFSISLRSSTVSDADVSSNAEHSSMKPVINFEGVVSENDNNRVTLANGQIIIITEDTVFGGDADTNNTVSKDILAGNFIQGYTEDDTSSDEITANRIWTNESRTGSGGKRVINFEGRVIKVENDIVTLENGKTVEILEDTTVTAPDGSNSEISEGNYIQGYTENTESNEIIARYILITTL